MVYRVCGFDLHFPWRALLAIALTLCCASAHAVLPENSVDKTVLLLTEELDYINDSLESERGMRDDSRKRFWKKIGSLEEEITIAKLALLSQNANNPLGMAKATRNAHELLDKIDHFQKPVDGWMTSINDKINRTKLIRTELAGIDTLKLSTQGRAGRLHSIALCDSLESAYSDYMQNLAADADRYRDYQERRNELATTNNACLKQLERNIFISGNQTLPDLFLNFSDVNLDFAAKDDADKMKSDWKTTPDVVNEIDSWSLLGSIIAGIVVFIVFGRFKNKTKPRLQLLYRYRGASALLTLFLFNIAVDILTIIFIDAPARVYRDILFNTQFDFLGALIVLNQVLRRDGHKLRYLVFVWLPVIFTAQTILYVISEVLDVRTIMVFMVLVLACFTVLQLIFNLVFARRLVRADKVTAWVNLAVLTGSGVATCTGWTVLGVMGILTYLTIWTMWLVYVLLRKWLFAKVDVHKQPILKYTLRVCIYPLFVVFALVGSAYWIADIFNINTWLTHTLALPFVDVPDACRISAFSLLLLVVIGIIVNYAIGVTKRIFLRDDSDRRVLGKRAVAISMGGILLWMAYAIAVVLILHINHTGIIAAIGGASVGLGFALRDTIENFFYGITMMTGRARPGDIVECDGMRGYVRQVGIISTSIETEDGPIVSLPNRQLFSRNFKNLTVNDSQELRHIVIDIDADNDIDKARHIMLESVEGIDGVVPEGGHYVVMRNYGSGVVRMELKARIDTRKYLRAEPAVREAIYHAFRREGIRVANILRNIEARTTDGLMTDGPVVIPSPGTSD